MSTKIVKLSSHNVAAIQAAIDAHMISGVTLTATTATFDSAAVDASYVLSMYRSGFTASGDSRNPIARSLVAVIRKLDAVAEIQAAEKVAAFDAGRAAYAAGGTLDSAMEAAGLDASDGDHIAGAFEDGWTDAASAANAQWEKDVEAHRTGMNAARAGVSRSDAVADAGDMARIVGEGHDSETVSVRGAAGHSWAMCPEDVRGCAECENASDSPKTLAALAAKESAAVWDEAHAENYALDARASQESEDAERGYSEMAREDIGGPDESVSEFTANVFDSVVAPVSSEKGATDAILAAHHAPDYFEDNADRAAMLAGIRACESRRDESVAEHRERVGGEYWRQTSDSQALDYFFRGYDAAQEKRGERVEMRKAVLGSFEYGQLDHAQYAGIPAARETLASEMPSLWSDYVETAPGSWHSRADEWHNSIVFPGSDRYADAVAWMREQDRRDAEDFAAWQAEESGARFQAGDAVRWPGAGKVWSVVGVECGELVLRHRTARQRALGSSTGRPGDALYSERRVPLYRVAELIPAN